MDENFNPNRAVGVSNMSGDVPYSADCAGIQCSTGSIGGEAVADVEESLIAVLGGMGDGVVAVVGDVVAVRAGLQTYHPIKSIKVQTRWLKNTVGIFVLS